MTRAEALELFPMSPHPLPEPTKEMLEAIELFDEMHREIERTICIDIPRDCVAILDCVTMDGDLVRRAIRAAEMREPLKPEWPMTLVICQHHYEDPAFMEQLGDQPYVVTPRRTGVDNGRLAIEALARRMEPEPAEPSAYQSPRPSFRDRFPNDPVRNRRARQNQGRQGSRARGQKS